MVYELRGLIYSKYDSQKKCADAIGWTKQQMNVICSGKRQATVSEVYQLAEALDCDPSKIAEIFYQYQNNKKAKN